MNDDIKAAVDVGFPSEAIRSKPVPFPKSNADMPIGWMPVEQPNMRLEALKLAYEVAFRVDEFNAREWSNLSGEAQMKIFEEVLTLANINYQFITVGKTELS